MTWLADAPTSWMQGVSACFAALVVLVAALVALRQLILIRRQTELGAQASVSQAYGQISQSACRPSPR